VETHTHTHTLSFICSIMTRLPK